MTDNEYLEMPWSIEDTIENLNEIKENFKVILINKNLDGKASDDVKELEFDFDRAINALEKQIPKKPKMRHIEKYDGYNDGWCSCCEAYVIEENNKNFCSECGQKLDWRDNIDK